MYIKYNDKGPYLWNGGSPAEYTRMAYKGKDVYYGEPAGSEYCGPKRNMPYSCTEDVDLTRYSTLYIDPASKISRDVLRSNGFKITYSEDKADCIIIPPIDEEYVLNTQFAVKSGDSLYLYNAYRRGGDSEAPWTEEEKNMCIDEIKRQRNLQDDTEIVYDRNKVMEAISFWFVKKCDTYRKLLCGKRNWSKRYGYDTRIVFDNPGADITPESLLMWSKMDDIRLVEKAILNSNWQKYPCTIAVFLYREKNSCKYAFSPAGQVMLNSINYDVMYRSGSLGGQVITAEDWNMLQSYIMLRLGVDEKGGFVKDAYPYDAFIRSKMVVAPLKMNSEQTYTNVMNELNNSLG